VSPEELAARHPRLFHLTDPSALPGILKHGLLPASRLMVLYEVPAKRRQQLERHRRAESLRLEHPVHGSARISDNAPLSEKALNACLDDGLTPSDWMRLLNKRVFFWPDERSLADHLAARLIRGRERLVLVLDTLSLVRRYFRKTELAAINTGSTIRKPARRGLATFTPAHRHSYEAWQRLRGGRDRLREVTVLGGVADVAPHLLEHYRSIGRPAGS